MLYTQEFYEVMKVFEKAIGKGCRLEKENKDLWPKKLYYQSGEVNNLFISFLCGYALGKAREQEQTLSE